VFGATDGGNAFTGMPTSKAFFPTALSSNDPLANNAEISINAPGGGDYPNAISLTPQAPPALHVASLKKSGTDVSGARLDKIGTLAPTDTIEIGWSCDGTNTVGGGCPGSVGAEPFDFVVIVMQTSTTQRNNFTTPGASTQHWGTVSCFFQTGKGTTAGAGGNKRATAVIPAGAIATMLGQNSAAENHSYQIAVVRARAHAQLNNGGHTVFSAAGQGEFGLNVQ
jgi:hypothetical protein